MDFFNECREVGKRSDIVMLGKTSIENFVKFCLSLLLNLGIADHRQEKSGLVRAFHISFSSLQLIEQHLSGSGYHLEQ